MITNTNVSVYETTLKWNQYKLYVVHMHAVECYVE